MRWRLLAGVIALLGAAPLRAGADDAAAYFGVKAGVMAADRSGMEATPNGGLTIGYGRGLLALEAEFTTSLRAGATADPEVHWDITTLALYGSYRSPGAVYVKFKAGMLYEQINFDANGTALRDSAAGGSMGMGLGWQRPHGRRLELEYTLVERDVALLSMGYVF